MSKLKLTAGRHTVFLLCGPKNAGKSTLAELLLSKAQDEGTSRMIRGDFRIATLEAALKYPSNKQFVILDLDSLSADVQHQASIRECAEAHNYKVVLLLFDFKFRTDYTNLGSPAAKHLPFIRQSVNTFRRTTLPALRAKDFDQVVRIMDPVDGLSLGVEEPSPPSLMLSPQTVYGVIGDVHECVDELRLAVQFLTDQGAGYIFLLGDYLDKGGATRETLDYVHELTFKRPLIGPIVMAIQANHESYVAKRCSGAIEADPAVDVKFSSQPVIMGDPALRMKFLEVWSVSWASMTIKQEGQQDVVLTHAPCSNIHLGRMSPHSRLAQRNLKTKYMDEDYRTSYPFIFEEADDAHPLHIFGHVAHGSDQLRYKNKLFLDTGCVYGGKLSVFYVKDGEQHIHQIPATRTRTERVLDRDLTRPLQIDLTQPGEIEYEQV